jgi:hypothetical protein
MIVFQGGDDERGYRNMYKTPGGSKPHLGHYLVMGVRDSKGKAGEP